MESAFDDDMPMSADVGPLRLPRRDLEVGAQRRHLIARGLTRAQISPEGYWRPGRVGGHDHVED